MKNLSLNYPFKPFTVTQNWGVHNPAYAKQFDDPNFKRHNGIDAKRYLNDVTYPVYCPADGFRVERVQYAPNGGGNEIWLLSKTKMRVFEVDCYIRIIMCHAEKVLVPKGYEPAVGELLMMADNTGFSTGPHTHIGIYRLNDSLQKIDTNEATGSFDPGLFFTGWFAEDLSSVATRILSGMRYWRYLISA